MKRTLLVLLVVAAGLAAQPQRLRPRVKNAAIEAMERTFDQKISSLADNPMLLLGQTRGLYLEGYGAVFTAEVTLAIGPSINPFKQSINKEEIAQVYQKKKERLPLLKDRMRQMMLASAASLDEVPAQEQIVLGVRLLYRAYENTSGLPSQILMQAERGKLMDVQLRGAPLDQVLTVREF